jgi:hypothetical protein
VSDYRAYLLGSDGHIESFENVMAPDDERAVAIARKFVKGHNVELWHLARRVAILTPEGVR